MGFLATLRANRESGVFREIPLDCPGRLYTSPMPSGAYDKGSALLKIYQRHRIDHVFPLVTDKELDIKARTKLLREYEKRAIGYSRYIIGDYQAPSMDVLQALVEEAVRRLADGERIAVHCHAGVGRTSLAVACIAIAVNGMNPEEAVKHIRNNMTVNITSEQIRRLEEFARIDTRSREPSE